MDLVFVTSNDLKFKACQKILDVNLEQIKLPLVEKSDVCKCIFLHLGQVGNEYTLALSLDGLLV